jgi:hypothetical protein
MEVLLKSFKTTLKEQRGKYQQVMLQPVAHWEEEYEVLWREHILMYVQYTRGRLDKQSDVSIKEACMNREASRAKARKQRRGKL